MDAHITQLLSNNDPPAEGVIREVHGLLQLPLQELSETDANIENFEEQLRLLKEKRTKIERSINDYHTILSPIRRLPDDLLDEIFHQCLPTQRNPALVSSDSPLLLTRVCSKWRSLALSSPSLWAQLHITFCDDYRVTPPAYMNWMPENDKELQSHATSVLKLRCEVVKEWLMRSGSCPLSISIYYSSNAWSLNDIKLHSEDDLTVELFNTLLLFRQRWRDIELVMPIEIYRKLEDLVSPSLDTLSSLKSLKVNFHQQVPTMPGEMAESGPIALFRVPHLERLSLSGSHSRLLWMPDPIPFAAQGQNLTYICSYLMLSVTEALKLLKQCEYLVHCKLYITLDYAGHPYVGHQATQEPVDETPLNGVANLPRLISLSILEDIADDSLATRFYASIDAPNLKWLDYQRPHHSIFEGPEGPQVSLVHPPIFSLLRRLTQLKKLTVDPRGFLPAHLCEAFEMVSPTLTHLVIGQESSRNVKADMRMRRRRHNPLYHSPKLFDLDWLRDSSVKAGYSSDAVDASSDPTSASIILLPHLESLDWSMGSGPDELLLQFIIERMDPSASRRGISSLKRVWIAFERVKELDVPAEFARYREARKAEAGVEISEVKLELDYLWKEPEKEDEPLSAVFGLTPDGRSWFYDDIQESVR